MEAPRANNPSADGDKQQHISELRSLLIELRERIKDPLEDEWEKEFQRFGGRLRKLSALATNLQVSEIGVVDVSETRVTQDGKEYLTIAFWYRDPIIDHGQQLAIRSFILQERMVNGELFEVRYPFGDWPETRTKAIRHIGTWIRWTETELQRLAELDSKKSAEEAEHKGSTDSKIPQLPRAGEHEASVDTEAFSKLKPCYQKAFLAAIHAETWLEPDAPYPEIWDWLNENGTDQIPNLGHYDLPSKATFRDYISVAYIAMGRRKKGGRLNTTSRSIVKRVDLP
jgi:hypothetical protein